MKTKKSVLVIVTLMAMLSLSYAIFRYNIFGPVQWKDLPFYILNKAISLTAIILYTLNSCAKSLNKNRDKKVLRWFDNSETIEITSLLILIHVLMSLMLFKPEILEKFFVENGTISLSGGISMIAGIISFVLLRGLKLSSLSKNKITKPLISTSRILNTALLFITIHLFFMGYKGWISPGKWYGGMPPISLIAFLISSFGLLLKIYNLFDNSAKRQEHVIVK